MITLEKKSIHETNSYQYTEIKYISQNYGGYFDTLSKSKKKKEASPRNHASACMVPCFETNYRRN